MNPIQISRKLEGTIFGNEIEARVVLDVISLERAKERTGNSRMPDTTLADFEKTPQLMRVTIGPKNSAFKKLNSRNDKRVLLNSINMHTNEEAWALASMITIDSCLHIFDVFKIPIDYSKANSNLTLINTENVKPFEVLAFPIFDGYLIGGKLVKKLDEKHVLWGLTDENPVPYYELKGRPAVASKANPGMWHIIASEAPSDQAEKFKDLLRETLATWTLPVDASGTLRKKADFIKFLKVGQGYIPVSNEHLNKLEKGKKPKAFKYGKADTQADKSQQPINNLMHKTKCSYESDNDNDAVIIGYEKDYVESLIDLLNI